MFNSIGTKKYGIFQKILNLFSSILLIFRAVRYIDIVVIIKNIVNLLLDKK